MAFSWHASYAALPDCLYSSAAAALAPAPQLVIYNHAYAKALGLPAQLADSAAACLSGNQPLPGAPAPIALAYAGHQFGHYVPSLGDGRALLLGSFADSSGQLHDLQLKGSGRTPYSRQGDGRAALGPMLREYIVSEAMAALGVPTTRALAVVRTGERVARNEPLPGAVLARLARSHLRIGTFQYLATQGTFSQRQQLADYAIARHYPHCADLPNPYLGLLASCGQSQVSLVAQWMSLGFIHGVMNTDNASICGETLDFGPCAFMDAFAMQQVFSAIDSGGRYAYGNQPQICLWNLARLAQALLPLLGQTPAQAQEAAQQTLAELNQHQQTLLLDTFRSKLGLRTQQDGDAELLSEMFSLLEQSASDFTLFFRYLTFAAYPQNHNLAIDSLYAPPASFAPWLQAWQQRLAAEGYRPDAVQAHMCARNPDIVARNHRVEAVLRAADGGDLQPLQDFLAALRSPYPSPASKASAQRQQWMAAPSAQERVMYTFCGT